MDVRSLGLQIFFGAQASAEDQTAKVVDERRSFGQGEDTHARDAMEARTIFSLDKSEVAAQLSTIATRPWPVVAAGLGLPRSFFFVTARGGWPPAPPWSRLRPPFQFTLCQSPTSTFWSVSEQSIDRQGPSWTLVLLGGWFVGSGGMWVGGGGGSSQGVAVRQARTRPAGGSVSRLIQARPAIAVVRL